MSIQTERLSVGSSRNESWPRTQWEPKHVGLQGTEVWDQIHSHYFAQDSTYPLTQGSATSSPQTKKKKKKSLLFFWNIYQSKEHHSIVPFN